MLKLKCEKCGIEKYIVQPQNWTEEEEEKRTACPKCKEKMEVVAEDD